MLLEPLVYTEHASKRLSQRNLKQSEVEYVCKHGSRSVRAGAIFFFLGRRHVAEEDRRNDNITRLVGTTVLLDSHDAKTVITAYRNPDAPRKNRRKAKFNRKSSRPSSTGQLPLAA